MSNRAGKGDWEQEPGTVGEWVPVAEGGMHGMKIIDGFGVIDK